MTVRLYDGTRDAEALRTLNVEHQDFSRTLEPSWPEGTAVVDRYVAYLEKECAAHDGGVLLAESGGHVVGFVCVVASTRGDSPGRTARRSFVSA